MPVSRTVSCAPVSSLEIETRISPSNVAFKALERRFSTIFSHISRSTYTGSGRGGQSTISLSPARSTAERKTLDKLCREKRQIRRLVGGAHASHFDANEVEKAVHKLEQAQSVPMQHLQRLMRRRRLAQQRILNRTKDECERSAQFVAHVAEECGLGAIKIGQFFGASFFRFIGFGVRDAGGNLAGSQIEKAGIARVKLAVGVQCGDEDTSRLSPGRA